MVEKKFMPKESKMQNAKVKSKNDFIGRSLLFTRCIPLFKRMAI